MKDLIISRGWFEKTGDEGIVPQILCEHKANIECIDYDVGIEYCKFCGALGTFNVDSNQLDWVLPEYFTKRGYN